MAGLFFAFSASVMKALARLPSAEGIAAMQSINVAVLNPVFLAVFVGTAVVCLLVMVASLWRWHSPGTIYVLVGSALYLVGTFSVTMVCNVPKNDARYLQRNALVALGNTGAPDDLDLAAPFLDSEDELLREHARWAVARVKERAAAAAASEFIPEQVA